MNNNNIKNRNHSNYEIYQTTLKRKNPNDISTDNKINNKKQQYENSIRQPYNRPEELNQSNVTNKIINEKEQFKNRRSYIVQNEENDKQINNQKIRYLNF